MGWEFKMTQTIYDFSVQKKSNKVSLADYKNQVLLIVNVASE